LEDLFPLAASARYSIPVVDDEGKFMGEIHTSTILISMIQEKEMEEEKVEIDA
jgi:CBS-domain-containing membrane protein